jgi:hypothetical protein
LKVESRDSRGRSKTYHTRPAPIIPTLLSLQVSAFFIVENASESIRDPWRQLCHARDRTMLGDSIDDIFARRRFQGLLVGASDSSDGAALVVRVTGQ